MVSPASIKVLLALLAEGSSGETSSEILHALQLETATGAGQPDLAALRKLQTVLRVQRRSARYFPSERLNDGDYLTRVLLFLQGKSSTINLESRSKIYVAEDVSVRKDYETVVRSFYNADIQGLDFSDPERASTAVNEWVNNVTRGLIPTLVEKGETLYLFPPHSSRKCLLNPLH